MWDRTPALPLPTVCSWSGMCLGRLNQMAEALGPGKGRHLGGLRTQLLETWVVATCWGNTSDGREGSSLIVLGYTEMT